MSIGTWTDGDADMAVLKAQQCCCSLHAKSSPEPSLIACVKECNFFFSCPQEKKYYLISPFMFSICLFLEWLMLIRQVCQNASKSYDFANHNSAATFCWKAWNKLTRVTCTSMALPVLTLCSGTSSQMFYRFRRTGSLSLNKKEAKLQQRCYI